MCTFSLEEGKSLLFKGTELIILTLKGNLDTCCSTFVGREAYSDKSESFNVFETFRREEVEISNSYLERRGEESSDLT